MVSITLFVICEGEFANATPRYTKVKRNRSKSNNYRGFKIVGFLRFHFNNLNCEVPGLNWYQRNNEIWSAEERTM